MTRCLTCLPAPGPLEDHAAQFEDLITHTVERRGVCAALARLLLPRHRTKTLTALAGAEPLVEAHEPAVHTSRPYTRAGRTHEPAVQVLHVVLSESVWDGEVLNTRRLELL